MKNHKKDSNSQHQQQHQHYYYHHRYPRRGRIRRLFHNFERLYIRRHVIRDFHHYKSREQEQDEILATTTAAAATTTPTKNNHNFDYLHRHHNNPEEPLYQEHIDAVNSGEQQENTEINVANGLKNEKEEQEHQTGARKKESSLYDYGSHS